MRDSEFDQKFREEYRRAASAWKPEDRLVQAVKEGRPPRQPSRRPAARLAAMAACLAVAAAAAFALRGLPGGGAPAAEKAAPQAAQEEAAPAAAPDAGAYTGEAALDAAGEAAAAKGRTAKEAGEAVAAAAPEEAEGAGAVSGEAPQMFNTAPAAQAQGNGVDAMPGGGETTGSEDGSYADTSGGAPQSPDGGSAASQGEKAELTLETLPPVTEPPEGSFTAEGDGWGIALQLADVTPTGMTVAYTVLGDQTVSALGEYWLEAERDGQWEKVELLPEASSAGQEDSLSFPVGSTTEVPVDWSSLYGALPPGRYRFVQEFRLEQEDSAEAAETAACRACFAIEE